MKNAKTILGLDLGTNSIGWALVEQNFNEKSGKILGMGSRIIPMTQDTLGKFDAGTSISQTADRTAKRSARKLYQRDNLRRERLHRVMQILSFLPDHYSNEIDFELHKGQFLNGAEPKMAYAKNQDGKHTFLFKDAFNEMIEDFKEKYPDLARSGKKIPYDWTIYYLRKKALSEKLSNHELAWVILNFNQKRGYYQLSEESENEDKNKLEEYHLLKVIDVEDSGDRKRSGEIWYNIKLENGWIYKSASSYPLFAWKGTEKAFIVTTELDEKGNVKLNSSGEEKRSFRAPKEDDWGLMKKRTEFDIDRTKKTVGEYIYENLLDNPTQKIRGKLIRTIERKFYRDELMQILTKQAGLNETLQDRQMYKKCIKELYPNNEAHRRNIEHQDFLYLFINDIIFYQRPLKTKTHLISDCSLEYRIRKDTGEKVYLKCIPKSHPDFQEFRLWQFLSNLRIIERETDADVTAQYLNEDKWMELFDFLNSKETINQKQLLAFFKLKENAFRWNYVEEKNYPCNETRSFLLKRLAKNNLDANFINKDSLKHLWHILYSVTDPDQRKSALRKFAARYKLSEEFVNAFERFPLFKRDYGAFSEKAINKLLPLMRKGALWQWEAIDTKTRNRIAKIIDGEFDERIKTRVREKAINLTSEEKFCGLPLWLASYVVYDRHSEASEVKQWKTSQHIADFLNPKLKGSFKQHSLRNPIVEQVIAECLRVVKDIWDEYGNGEEGFFDEIHVELGREMKNPAGIRDKINRKNLENENTNIRIREILKELMESGTDVKPYSPSHQEILKIYEEGIMDSQMTNFDSLSEDDVLKIRKNVNPSRTDIQKYILWLQQGYVSPYTGNIINLSQLFTHHYEIEHIFPQSRYFDDSLNNKIICEAEVNKLKDNSTAYEFIREFGGTKVALSGGKSTTILSLDKYEAHVKTNYAKNRIKKQHLLSSDIPESFINRQLNDSRYISKVVKNLLGNIVRGDDELDAGAKKMITMPGSITSQLRHDWGLNDIWNELITPRFQRLNELTNSTDFGTINPSTGKFLPTVPDHLLKGFNKKRIDHRHHALDALVIACTTQDHINYITSLNTQRENFSLVQKLREVEEIERTRTRADGTSYSSKAKVAGKYLKPWANFTLDAKQQLQTIIVSFKQNTRVINKTKNKYWKWVNENGKKFKKQVFQTKGDNWAIRKSLHKASVYGKVNLRNDGQNIVAHASRVQLSESFTRKQLNSVTDSGIRKILNNHVARYKDNKGKELFELAFNSDGLEALNKNIVELNEGKFHQPIYAVRIYEIGNKFNVGNNGNRKHKFVEADKGTNLFFVVYEDESTGKRNYETVPLVDVIEWQKQEAHLPKIQRTGVPINPSKGKFLFFLSPNDLVYVCKKNDLNSENFAVIDQKNTSGIYKMVSSTGKECHFIKQEVSSLILPYKSEFGTGEFGSLNKSEITIELSNSIRIKEHCVKINVNRLGLLK